MDKNKKKAIIYYVTAVICYIFSIIWFCSDNSYIAAMLLCIGSANLCYGSIWIKRSKEAKKEENKEEKSTDQQDNK